MTDYEVRKWRRRRGRRRLLALLVVLVVGFHLGAGWYFSSQIRSDGLLVKDQSDEFDIAVVAVDEETIELAKGEDPPDDLTRPDLLGVAHRDGYGQAGEMVRQTAESVTRRYAYISGEPVAAGDMVRLEGFAYPPSPRDAFGIDFGSVTYTSPVGALEAWLVPGRETRWVISVHGRGSHMREGLRALPAFVDSGLPTLLISYRNDEGAPLVDGRLARFGATEWEDLEAAVQYAVAHGAEDVVLVGYSMGGAIVMAFLERSSLADRVTGIVLDAPALKLGAMVDARAADSSLPLVGLPVPITVTATAKLLAALRFDVDWEEIDYLDDAGLVTVPVLLIHGTEDDSVPLWTSEHFADDLGELVAFEVFLGAGHVRSWNTDPDRYMRALAEFLVVLG